MSIHIRTRGLDDAVDRAADGVIAPPGEQIASVDNARILDGSRVHKVPVGAPNLQATPRVLEQQGDGAIVGVLAGSDLAGVDAKHLLLDGRVVQQAQGVVAVVDKAVEEGRVEAHADGDGPHHLDVQRLALVEEVEHDGFEVAHGVDRGGPLVGVVNLALAPDLEALLDVGYGATDGLDLGCVCLLRHLLPAGCRVAAVRLRGRPATRELGLERKVEELGRGPKHVLARLARDWDVAQVDKTSGLEAVQNGLGRLQSLVISPIEEFGKIN